MGLLGGILAELLDLFKLRRVPASSRPIWLKDPFYWTLSILMMPVGGILVDIYLASGFDLKALLAVNVGASAPLILETLVNNTPRIDPGKIG